jgi:hypothetical protein
MHVLKSYYTGIKQASGRGKMVALLWILNLLFAAVVYRMAATYFSQAFGVSAIAEDLLHRFDTALFMEMLVHSTGPQAMMLKVMGFLSFLYFWVSLFLTGGILQVLSASARHEGDESPNRRFAAQFFQGAGKYFGRFFRLAFYSLFLWVALLVFQYLLYVAAKFLTGDWTDEKMMFILFWIWAGLGLVQFFFISMVLDYARISIVLADSRHVLRALFASLGFVFKRLLRTSTLYAMLLFTGLAIFLLYWAIHSTIPARSTGSIWLAFAIGQIFILSRGWLKIAFQAAQLEFYRHR